MKSQVPRRPVEPSHGFTAADLKTLLEPRGGPCVSIYFPAHRRKIESRSDSILYRNLCREVERILEKDTAPAIARKLVSTLRSLDEPEFWEHGSEGVAVFAAPDHVSCFRLPIVFPALEVVGGSFHTKPLIGYLQRGQSYNVLVLSLHRVSLLDGSGDRVQEVPLRDVPTSLEEIVEEKTPGHYRGSHPRGEDHHQQGDGGDRDQADLERFFREVARGLVKNGLKESGKPLILAAQKHHQAPFRRVAQFPRLMEQGIVADATKLTRGDIAAAAREILQPAFEQQVTALSEEYGLAVSRGHGSEVLTHVARAAAEGRVKQLFVEGGRRFFGLLERESGQILPGEEHKNAYDVDVYDELAELVLIRGGDVLVLPREKMPAKTGIAAIFRF